MNHVSTPLIGHKSLSVLRWVARIWGSLSVAFLLFMILGHIIDGDEPFTSGFTSTKEVLIFFLFPVCTLIGLWMAWRMELLGSLMALIGVAGLFLLRQDLILDLWICVIVAPAVLYLIAWWFSRKGKSDTS